MLNVRGEKQMPADSGKGMKPCTMGASVQYAVVCVAGCNGGKSWGAQLAHSCMGLCKDGGVVVGETVPGAVTYTVWGVSPPQPPLVYAVRGELQQPLLEQHVELALERQH